MSASPGSLSAQLRASWGRRAIFIVGAVSIATTALCYAPYFGRWRATWDGHVSNVIVYAVCFLFTLAAAPLVRLSVPLPALARCALAFATVNLVSFLTALVAAPIQLAAGVHGGHHDMETAMLMSLAIWPAAASYAFLEIDRYAQALRARERRLMRVETALRRTQGTVGRLKMNPHFLFNTLNSISSLILVSRNEDAELMTSRLSDFMRASLLQVDALVTLDEELETLEAYLDLERVRFGSRLDVRVEAPSELLGLRLPSFVLQPLVENAIKYAVQPSREPVQIRVRVTSDGEAVSISVENDPPVAPAGPPPCEGSGTALISIRQRLEEVFPGKGQFTAGSLPSGGWRAVLRLPTPRPAVRDVRALAPAV